MGAKSADGRRLARWAAIVAAVTIVLAIGTPLIGRGVFIGVDVIRTFPPWNADTPSSFVSSHSRADDTVNAGTPSRVAIRRGLVDEHHVPLWDPFPNGGTPLGSQPSSGLLSPLNWPELLLGVRLGAAWAGLLRLAVAAIGGYFLLRRLGVSRFSGVCGGLIYCANGFIIGWNNFPQADIAALLPALFLTGDILRERRRARDVAAFAAVVAAMLLEGYPPLFVASLYALAVFLVVRWWESSHRAAAGQPSISARVRRAASRLRDAFAPTALVVGALALGAAIAAFQLLPFLLRLGQYDLSYRSHDQRPGAPAAHLITMVFPWALGKPAHVGTQAANYVHPQGRVFFVGAAAVVFALWAVVRGRPAKVSRGVYRYCLAGATVLLLALVGNPHDPIASANGPVTAVLYVLPGMNQVWLSRLVALFLLFVTLLAAFGIEHVITSTDSSTLRPAGRWRVRVALILAFGAYFGYAMLRSEERLLSSMIPVGGRLVHEIGDRSWILRNSIMPALLAIAAIVVIVGVRRWHDPLRRVAIGAIPVMLAVETLLVTTPLFPRSANSDFYPQTPSLQFLARHLGNERYAAPDRMLFPSTNTYYGLRSVTGHSFSPPAWHDLIAVASPGTSSTPTRTVLGDSLDVATSPVLDRLSARFFVADAHQIGFGKLEPASPASGSVEVGRGATARGTVGPGPLRAVELTVVGRTRVRGDLDFLEVTMRDQRDTIVARGSRRFKTQAKTTGYFVPIAGELLARGAQPWHIEVALRSDAHDTARIATTADGHASLGVVRPAADGLRLVHTDAGAAIYRRLSALPRIRWASHATVVPNPKTRIARLADGSIGTDTVILDQPGPPANGAPANVVVQEDSGDQMRVKVHARGTGYLVVADAIQDGWSARVDGHPITLRHADHALVAIPVPAGNHTVALSAAPRGWHLGIAISIVATLVFVLLLTWAILRRRNPGGTSTRG